MQRKIFRRALGTLGFLLLILAVHAQTYTVTGGKGTPLLALDDSRNKLQVYLVYGMEDVEIRYTPQSGNYQWYRFKNKAVDGEPISSTVEGEATVVRNLEEGYGYYVMENGAIGYTSAYIWIIDYSKYAFDLTKLSVDAQLSTCDNMYLKGEPALTEMRYSIPETGYSTKLEREFEVSYQTMKESEDNSQLVYETVTETVKDPFRDGLKAPYSDTEVTLTGDLFARHFGVEKTMTTETYQAKALLVITKADTISYEGNAPNVITKDDGLSAPVEFHFSAIANVPVASLFTWIITRKDESESGVELARIPNNEEIDYTFTQNGDYLVELYVNDRTGECEYYNSFDINISDSFIDVPNAFSPGTTPGINDEFKVAYRSLTRFNCWIFNRWGVELYHWTDPAKGWDGKKGGKYVAPGVYFYVIEATGSDGKSYKKKGSINILRSKEIQDEIIEE